MVYRIDAFSMRKCSGNQEPGVVASIVKDTLLGRIVRTAYPIIIDAKGKDGALRAVAMSLVR